MLTVCLISFNLAFFPSFFAYAATSITDLTAQKKALEEKAKQAAAAQAQKEKEAAAISGQIVYVENQITQTQGAIVSTDSQVAKTQDNIVQLSANIIDQEKNLASEQKTMDKVITSLYMEGDAGLLESLLSSNSISEAITNQQYYEAIQQQVEGSIQRITAIKNDLSNQKDQKDKQLTDLTSLKLSQVDQKKFLESRKVLKSELLSDTKNAVKTLETEQSDAKVAIAAIQQRINSIKAASVGAGGDLISTTSSFYYQQVDPAWSGYVIGKYVTIGAVGCLITSLSMVAKFYGKNYTPATAADISAFDRSGSYNTDGRLLSTSIVDDGHNQAIDWTVVDDELANNHPVVVGVVLRDANGNAINMGDSFGVTHYVVVIKKLADGKYGMLDPLGTGRGYYKKDVKATRIIRP